LTVAEIFTKANLSPRGPVPWGTQVAESSVGVYVVARVGDPTVGCNVCALQFIDFANPFDNLNNPIPPLDLDPEYERQRWLQNEPVVYIGQTTDQTIQERVRQFYRHKCGNPSPNAGGQVIHLLRCDMWVYWSPADNPYDTEQTMLCTFKEQVGQEPFANGWSGKRKRIRRSN
jgi:hypothetical protein